MNREKAREVLKAVKGRNGRTYKSKIREAWFSGNYRGLDLEENEDSHLQQIRNELGPSFLVNVRV